MKQVYEHICDFNSKHIPVAKVIKTLKLLGINTNDFVIINNEYNCDIMRLYSMVMITSNSSLADKIEMFQVYLDKLKEKHHDNSTDKTAQS